MNPTRMNVVLVTFSNEDAMPYGYTRTGNVLTPGTDSYTMDDFEKKFGVSGSFTGSVTVGRNETLPASYGSLRDYFYEISGGALNLSVRIVNRELSNGYPEWIVLPNPWSHYNMPTSGFLDPALAETNDYIDEKYGSSAAYDNFPTRLNDSTEEVVVFVYSGWQVQDPPDDRGALHPHAQRDGCCYVTGERQGNGNPPPDPAATFTGIGIHAHEMGHVLGVNHPQVRTDDTNVYTNQIPGVSTYWTTNDEGEAVQATVPDRQWVSGSIAGWCTMHSGWDGPSTEGSHVDQSAYYYSYASCPNPYNPFHMRHLKESLSWNNRIHSISTAQRSYRINPAPEDYYHMEALDTGPAGYPAVMLEFRDANSFGRYNGWYEFERAPGLVVWRRNSTLENSIRLIPADNRRIYNALEYPTNGQTVRLWDESFVYPWIDRLSDPFGALKEVDPVDGAGGVEANGLRQTIRSMKQYQGLNNANAAALPSHMKLDGETHRVTPDWATDATHFRRPALRAESQDAPLHIGLRNIVVHRGTGTSSEDGYAVLNIYPNYWERPITEADERWSGEIYVGADIEIRSGAQLTIESGSTVHFLTPRPGETGSGETGHSELIVHERGRLHVKSNVTFKSANEAINPADPTSPITYENESHGLHVMDGGEAVLDGLTISDGTHYMYAHSNGKIVLWGDLVVKVEDAGTALLLHRKGSPADAVTLQLKNGIDLTSGGQDTGQVELLIQEGAALDASNDIFRPTDTSSDAAWFGIRSIFTGAVTPKTAVDLTGATLRDGTKCASKEGGSLTLGNTTFTDCGLVKDLARSIQENTQLVALSVLDDIASSSISWSIEGGADQGDFVIEEENLKFSVAPDFENPQDDGTNNTYIVKVQAQTRTAPADALRATVADFVTITVTDDPSEAPTNPGAPEILKQDSSTNTQLIFRIRLTTEVTGSEIDALLWRVSFRNADPDLDQGISASSWMQEYVAIPLDRPLNQWFATGKQFEWNVHADRVYTLEAKAGHCKATATDCEDAAAAADFVEDNYVWSDVGSLQHTTPPEPLLISGKGGANTAVDYWEDYNHETDAIAEYQADAGPGRTVAWSLVDNSEGYFEIASSGDKTGELSFTSRRPAYNANGNNTYSVKIKAQTSRRQSTSDYPVSVTLIEDTEGVVEITYPGQPDRTFPDIGDRMEGVLTDPDDVDTSTIIWQWWRSGPPGTLGDYTEVPDGMNAIYTPIDLTDGTEGGSTAYSDRGRSFRVTATYDDAHGSGKEVISGLTNRVPDSEDAVTPLPRPDTRGSVTLTYVSPPRVEEAITATLEDPDTPTGMAWEWRRRRGGDPWTVIPGETSSSVMSQRFAHKVS